MCGTARSTFLALICGLLVSGGAFVTLMAVDQSLLGANNEPGAQARGGAADDLVVARIGLLADQRHVLTRPPVTRRPRTKARREHPQRPPAASRSAPHPLPALSRHCRRFRARSRRPRARTTCAAPARSRRST